MGRQWGKRMHVPMGSLGAEKAFCAERASRAEGILSFNVSIRICNKGALQSPGGDNRKGGFNPRLMTTIRQSLGNSSCDTNVCGSALTRWHCDAAESGGGRLGYPFWRRNNIEHNNTKG